MLELTAVTNKNCIKSEQISGSEGVFGQPDLGGIHNPALLALADTNYGLVD